MSEVVKKVIAEFAGLPRALSLRQKARTARICLYTCDINDFQRAVLTGVELKAEDCLIAYLVLIPNRKPSDQLHVNTVSLKLLCYPHAMQAAADTKRSGIPLRCHASPRSCPGRHTVISYTFPFHLQFLHFSISRVSMGSASSAVSMTCRKTRLASTFS